MPGPDKPKYASKAQQRLFHSVARPAGVSQAAVDRRDKNTNFKKLVKRASAPKK